ncbi:hypothetical protein M878_27185 [Streptomyces roseochromogenus subsp. oscitans DS 12.976]|uniref:Uncharacterized protein n=1 Tax=Streptomyces roseochromogenus subsp. oscitans DS 12.976 TaxID=1352936 RepID=V6K2U5_STRRC|nr:hypothetical protein M878_27185 [Streptomyces roseochromogenus subsp. oscitans DS 12.976]
MRASAVVVRGARVLRGACGGGPVGPAGGPGGLGGVEQLPDAGAGPAALQVQPADVDPVLGEQGQYGGAAGRVGGDIAALAAHQQLPEAAVPGGVGDPHGDAERGGGEGGETLRVDSGRVVGDDESVDAGRERAGELRHPSAQPVQLVQDGSEVVLGHHQLSPLGGAVPFKAPPAHP